LKGTWEEDAEAEATLAQKTTDLSIKEFKLNTSAKEFVPTTTPTNTIPANTTPTDTATDITPANTTPANTTPANTTPAKTTPAKNADKKPNVTDQGEDGIGDEVVDNQIIQDLYGKEHINLVFIGHV
ncbi:8762_t:CDS:2, partial [Racocetra fulgida]